MKIHTIFVEPANYTHDLILNVYSKFDISYSFLFTQSTASNENSILRSANYIFEENNFWSNFKYLWKCVKKNDLIIINGYNHVEFRILWLFSIVNKCFIGIESDTPYRSASKLKGVIKKIYLNIIFSNKKILGFPGGNGLHRDLFSNYGMDEKRIFFLPMMIDNLKFKSTENKDKNFGKLKFLFVGRLVPEKNLEVLIKTFIRVLSKKENIELILIGNGVCENSLISLAQNNKAVHFLGKKFGKDLVNIYADAHVFILPSCFEPWGLVVNEAMAAGLPVICSSAAGAAIDMIEKPNTGWIFSDNNEEELYDLLLHIIENPKEIQIKGLLSTKFMEEYWNYDLYIKCLKKIIQYVDHR